MNLLHLSFVGGLKATDNPPVPLTAEERLRAFRAAYPVQCGNAYRWPWQEHGAETPDLSRAMLERIARQTRQRVPA
jgi:hypothetical protein